VERRQLQLFEQGHIVDYEDILHNLYERDYIDSTRSDSPLMRSPEAIVIDNSNLTPEEQLAICALLARHRMEMH
jgi:cytidylate kinase